MKTITSVSGGRTSAYIAANYHSDYLLFSLVRIEKQKDYEVKWMKGKDEPTRNLISDRIGKEFYGTAEEDKIIYTILDLEQYLGKKINIVSGITYDEVIRTKGGWLPNKLHRYCTTHLKLEPMFYWWAENTSRVPVKMNIGFRANETNRAKRMIKKLNSNGLLEFKGTFTKNKNGTNHWETFQWQKPNFPLIKEGVYNDQIIKFWKNKAVRFAHLNNCVGCFHRNPILLRKEFEWNPNKMRWFKEQEQSKQKKNVKATWRSDVSYSQIEKHRLQHELFNTDFSECDSGYCSY